MRRLAFATAAGVALLGAARAPLAAQVRTDTTFTVGSMGTLRLETHEGSILVRGGEDGRIRLRVSHPAGIELEMRATDGGVRVEAETRRGVARGVEYEVTIPRGWNVNAEAHSAPIVIEDTRGAVTAENVQGAITLTGIGGARVESVGGAVTVRDATGDLNIETVNEGVRIDGVTGDVVVETVNGAILLANTDGSTVRATTVNGRIEFQGRIRPGGRYEMDTHNGDITVHVPAGAGASVTVATHQGSVEADFPVAVRGSRRGELEFDIGDGGARLGLESFNGRIRILRAGNSR